MRISHTAFALFPNILRSVKGGRRAQYSQAPFPAQTERKTHDSGRDPMRQGEADFGKETGAQDTEWLQRLDYFLKNGGWGIRDLYLIRQSTQEVPEIKARGFFFSPVST